MLETIYQTAIHTPWWVYVLLVVLFKMGMAASKPSIVSLFKLAIALIIFSFMAIETLINNFTLDTHVLSIFFVALLIGMTLGWIQIAKQTLAFDRKNT